MQKRIFVDNLAPSATAETVAELFSRAGTVASVTIPPDQKASGANSHAFVEMATGEEAAKAIHILNAMDWNGLRLTVTQAGPVQKAGSGFSGGTLAHRPHKA